MSFRQKLRRNAAKPAFPPSEAAARFKKVEVRGTVLQRFCRIPMQIWTSVLLRRIQLAMRSTHLIKDHL